MDPFSFALLLTAEEDESNVGNEEHLLVLLKHGKNKTELCYGLFSKEAGDSIN